MDTIHAIGRRKASVARIYLKKGKGAITINKKDYKDFFPVESLQQRLLHPFSVLDLRSAIVLFKPAQLHILVFVCIILPNKKDFEESI